MKRFIAILFSSICFFGCDPVDDTLTLFNHTSDTIYYSYSNTDFNRLYNHELESAAIPQTYLNYVKIIPPNSKVPQLITGAGKAWERYVLQFNKEGNLNIYTFNIHDLKNKSWKEVVQDSSYQTKQQFSLDDLKKIRWEVKLRR